MNDKTNNERTVRRLGKRVIIIPEKRTAHVSQRKQEKQQQKLQKPKPKPKPAPSINRTKALDQLLKKSSRTWRDYAPMTRDGSFEKSIRKLAEERGVYHSKVLLAKLLKQHKSDKRYITKLMNGTHRQGFHGNQLEPITAAEKDNAAAKIAKFT